MNIELSDKEFRRLLDMVYIGNWILNSARGEDGLDAEGGKIVHVLHGDAAKLSERPRAVGHASGIRKIDEVLPRQHAHQRAQTGQAAHAGIVYTDGP